MKTKICTCCNKRKYLKYFHKQLAKAGGVRSICISCRSRTRTDINTEAVKKAKLKYRHSKHGKIHEQIYNNSEIHAAMTYRWGQKNKYKVNAAAKARRAIKNGVLKKKTTCEICSSKKNIQGHHNDYTKPLKVRWLCAKCHRQWHADN